MGEERSTSSDVADAWDRIVDRLRHAVAGEFEILREIGSGGMAAVYLARQIALNRQVAIKVMSPALLTGAGMVERFRQEAITIAGLDHPNIITIYAVRHYEDLHFFVMKFIKGRSLEHVIRTAGPLPIPMVRGLLFMIGSALAHAHRRNVIHRDIKPANILIDGEGNAIVTDFGIAKVSEDQSQTQTHSGVIIGTAAYMSPEQCYALPAKAASDQYSLGVVAYEMVTGRPPFSGSQFVVMQAHTERPVPPMRELRRDCPPELEAAIVRMLAKDPADRWPSMQHALAELGAAPLLEGHPVRAALARLGVPEKEKREPEPVPKPYVSSVAILAPPDWIEAGDEMTLRASARNWSGDTMPGVLIRWQTNAPEIATVDETHGTVMAQTPGMVVITASVENVQSSVTLQVVPRRVAAVNVSIPPGTIHAGDRVQIAVRTEDKAHAEIKRPVAWMTSDPVVATISDAGVLFCKTPGLALVFAEAEGKRGSAEVRVAPARVARVRATMAPSSLTVGDRIALGAMPLDAVDNILDDRPVAWASSDPNVATITADGIVTAHREGNVEFTCSCEGKSTVVEVRVEEPAPITAESPIEPPPEPSDDVVAADASLSKFFDAEQNSTSEEAAAAEPPAGAYRDDEAPAAPAPTIVDFEPAAARVRWEPEPPEPVVDDAVAPDRAARTTPFWRQRRTLVAGGASALVLVLAIALWPKSSPNETKPVAKQSGEAATTPPPPAAVAESVAVAAASRDSQPAAARADKVYFASQVSQTVSPSVANPRPDYPEQLRSANLQGEVVAQFVVDASGRADLATFKVIRSTHALFSDAVRRALPRMAFSPARLNGNRVRQLVQMPFDFKLVSTDDGSRDTRKSGAAENNTSASAAGGGEKTATVGRGDAQRAADSIARVQRVKDSVDDANRRRRAADSIARAQSYAQPQRAGAETLARDAEARISEFYAVLNRGDDRTLRQMYKSDGDQSALNDLLDHMQPARRFRAAPARPCAPQVQGSLATCSFGAHAVWLSNVRRETDSDYSFVATFVHGDGGWRIASINIAGRSK